MCDIEVLFLIESKGKLFSTRERESAGARSVVCERYLMIYGWVLMMAVCSRWRGGVTLYSHHLATNYLAHAVSVYIVQLLVVVKCVAKMKF